MAEGEATVLIECCVSCGCDLFEPVPEDEGDALCEECEYGTDEVE